MSESSVSGYVVNSDGTIQKFSGYPEMTFTMGTGAPASKNKGNIPGMVKCSICGARIFLKHLNRHKRRVHGVDDELKNHSTKKPATPSTVDKHRLRQCPFCNQFFTLEQISVHKHFCRTAPVPCPYCHQEFPRNSIVKHQKHCHLSPENQFVECPHCGRKVVKRHYMRHINHCSKIAHEEIVKTPKERPLTTCPDCGCSVRVDRLARHLGRCKQPHRSVKRTPATIHHPAIASNPGKWRNSKQDHLNSEPRYLDATRDTWRRRDHGRFGSLSNYDDYGDESMP